MNDRHPLSASAEVAAPGDQATLSTGPAPARASPPPRPSSRPSPVAAIMICLVLTIFANLFPAGERRGPGGAGRGCGRV